MCKLWLIQVDVELQPSFIAHIRQDKKPTHEQALDLMDRERCIIYQPGSEQVTITEVNHEEERASTSETYKLHPKQCAEIALRMYDDWKRDMKPPHFAYYNFETWLKKFIEYKGE